MIIYLQCLSTWSIIKFILVILIGILVLQAPGEKNNSLAEGKQSYEYFLWAGKSVQRAMALLLLVGLTTSVLIPNISEALEKKQYEGDCTWLNYEKLCQEKCYYWILIMIP